MKKKYDAIIIGAGLGGLSTACFLNKLGLKILLVEKNEKVGGYCSFFKRNDIEINVGPHYVGSCSKGGLLKTYFEELGLENIETIKPTKIGRLVFPDETFEIPNDFFEYIECLKNKFKLETKIEVFFQNLNKIRLLKWNSQEAKDLRRTPYSKYLDSYFRDPKLKSILSSQWWFLGVIPEQLSTYHMATMMMSYVKDGLYFVKGGGHKITDALKFNLSKKGCDIIVGKKVEKILISEKRAKGITLSSGEIYLAENIVSCIDFRQTCSKLIGSQYCGKSYINEIDSSLVSPSAFTTFFVLNYKNIQALQNIEGWYYASYDYRRGFGEFYYISVPTISETKCTDNKNALIVVGNLDCGVWDTKEKWKRYKQKKEIENVRRLKKVFGVLEKHLILKESATSKTYESFTGNYRGAIYGFAASISQTEKTQDIFRNMPIENLYFAGHWTCLGGGVVPVFISAKLVSQKLTKKYSKGKK